MTWRPDLDAYESTLVRACERASKFVGDMARNEVARKRGEPLPVSPYWLTLSGPQGTGKTMLARQILAAAATHNPGDVESIWVTGSSIHDAANRRPRRVWYHSHALIDAMKAGEWDLPEYLAADFLLVLDDLGAARDKSEFGADSLYRLAERRMNRWTVWTTNLTLDEIAAKLDPRISSRLIRDDNKIVSIKAQDYATTGRRRT